jgi:hypothetical protein
VANLPGVVDADAPQLNASETSAGEDAATVVQLRSSRRQTCHIASESGARARALKGWEP